jgi:hypothetical protein
MVKIIAICQREQWGASFELLFFSMLLNRWQRGKGIDSFQTPMMRVVLKHTQRRAFPSAKKHVSDLQSQY